MMAMSMKQQCISICAPGPTCELGWFASPCMCTTSTQVTEPAAVQAQATAAGRSRRGRGIEE